MSAAKTVRVDNWGIYVLQRFKHFFNRTDYCDLTLQFQDNAQLKVHRLMLSSCTEYFEVLERTCEMYEDCLVMPDDLQADVVVPIINFMYTGQLEFRMELLEKLHACSEIMNMPVLTKLLDSHRPKAKTTQSYSKKARLQNIQTQQVHQSKFPPTASLEVVEPPVVTSNKRSHAKAFETTTVVLRDKKHQYASNKASVMNVTTGGLMYRAPSPVPLEVLGQFKPQKSVPSEPRPTRYELPEELDSDNLFENSFTNISYTSQPLMIHPERTKQYAKRPKQDKGSPSSSKKARTLDIIECKKVSKEYENSLFGETSSSIISDEVEMFRNFEHVNVKTESNKDPNQLFDQLLDEEDEHSTKVTIEAPKNNKSANLDHAKIISEVLKKYPHLVKNNKNIKLKIFNNPTPSKVAVKKQKAGQPQVQPVVGNMNMGAISDFTYETDVIDSKQAARLIALGAENTEGPWICLICGTPGKALHFTSYYKFRRHLVEVHKEKPVQNICEHCGQRMSKRNHLLHHLYSKHGVEPPSSHHFPKCQHCNYIALNEALLVKHKLTHIENKSFRCNVCPSMFNSSKMLLNHIQTTGHKYIADRKPNHQCIYCLRVFIRENNLYAHLKTHHKVDALKDGIIDASDDESKEAIEIKYEPVAHEVEDNLEYHIQHTSNGNIQLIPKKSPAKQTILNTGLTPTPKDVAPKSKVVKAIHDTPTETENKSFDNGNEEEIVMIDNNEYIMRGDRLILRNAARQIPDEFILSDMDLEKSVSNTQSIIPSTSVDYAAMISTNENIQQASILMKNTGNLGGSIPIYVSNEDEYKALIAANHNIIFDAADENKTLTVLTTSEAGTLNSTGIDLDNAQNSDMMIIQDNYPLNVSEEAVVTDNSNIVVVYSQHVGDPNKGYQLLTTQALDPQYASGILTHNYETVSTASPVSRAQILDPPVTTWQGQIPQNINKTNSSAVLQSIAQPEVQVSKAHETNNDVNDLPEIQLKTVISQPAVISQIEETHNGTPSKNLQHESEMIQTAQIIPIQVDEPDVAIIENEMDTNESDSENTDHQTENEMEIQATDQIPESGNINELETQAMDQIPETENINEMESQAIDLVSEPENISEVETEIIRIDDLNSDSTNTHGSGTDENDRNEVDETVEEAVIEASAEHESNKNNVIPTEVVEEIHTLASEWSEEDMSQDAEDNTNKVRADVDTESEVEESIENIQHELAKQTAKDKEKPGNVEVISQEILSHNESGPSETLDPKVKVSSLLNDWDDSQEDNQIDKNDPTVINTEIPVTVLESNSESQDHSSTISEEDEIIDDPTADTEVNVPGIESETKQDKIKSLVSDWDDDEEEKE